MSEMIPEFCTLENLLVVLIFVNAKQVFSMLGRRNVSFCFPWFLFNGFTGLQRIRSKK